jgi:DNA-binding NtrC family response regulator
MNSDNKPSVLVVDDDKNTRDGLERALKRTYDVYVAENAVRALEILAEHRIEILLSDVRMPGMDGLALLQRAIAHSPDLICILLTAYGNVEVAVTAMKQGAYDFLMKPVNLDHLDILLQRALHSRDVESENMNLHEQLDTKFGMENIVGHSSSMLTMFETIRQTAPTQATVLITGETGTGKELVAHAIHRLSTRSRGPFVAVHCAALAANLLESELFGHEKGAFTGAVSRRRGRFETADGGTLFLDEISEVEPSVQVKLLRVLEERTFERVGGDETIEVDIRIVTATNQKLRELVDEGKFREDLYFRLDVVNIELPPLRDRTDDIPLLCNGFLKEFNEKNAKEIQSITGEACNVLSAYSWPGNVRELRNTIEKMVVLARGTRLTPRDIPANIREAVKEGGYNLAIGPGRQGSAGTDSLADAEKHLIQAALARNKNNITQASKDLGISRRTLHRKLKTYKEESAEQENLVDTSETDANSR